MLDSLHQLISVPLVRGTRQPPLEHFAYGEDDKRATWIGDKNGEENRNVCRKPSCKQKFYSLLQILLFF